MTVIEIRPHRWGWDVESPGVLSQVFELAQRIVVLRHGRRVAVRPIEKTTREEIVGLITGATDGLRRALAAELAAVGATLLNEFLGQHCPGGRTA